MFSIPRRRGKIRLEFYFMLGYQVTTVVKQQPSNTLRATVNRQNMDRSPIAVLPFHQIRQICGRNDCDTSAGDILNEVSPVRVSWSTTRREISDITDRTLARGLQAQYAPRRRHTTT